MDDIQEKDERLVRCIVGYDSESDPKVMVVSIPIGRCAEDAMEGTVLLRGWTEEIKNIGINIIKMKRQRKAASGLVKTNGVSLGVVQ